ncbi:MAG: hypothetical protein Q8O89_04400 [Nanoarchaeota archaeon]|nr:hypothetical protein [Nanoarchaeota archaeon]
MSKKEIFKIYYQDSKLKGFDGERIIDAYTCASQKLSIPIKINFSQENSVVRLPDNYEFYFIHLRDLITRHALTKVRETNPISYIVAITNHHLSHFPSDIRECFDRKVDVIFPNTIESILIAGFEKVTGEPYHK